MNEELLESLIGALSFSPENSILRKQVVQGLLELRRWKEIQQYAEPLLLTDCRPFALLAMAKAAFADGNTTKAAELYSEAIHLDADLVDEQFEAALEVDERMRLPLPLDDYEEDDLDVQPAFLPYNGPRLTFEDVGGMDALKEQIRMNIIYPFQHPELYAAYGKKAGGGIMLYGPPGCGKTYMARATAGELGANFYFLELNEILDMWVGQSEKHLSGLFKTARDNKPSVIFIDEIDAIGAKRSEVRSSGIRLTVTQLLTEMDGLASQNDQLLVMGATNTPWDVDAAFRRPGRFDRVLFVPPPDQQARIEVLKLHIRGRKIAPDISWASVADKCEHYSGADLASLVDRACELVLADAIKHGNFRDVKQADFQRALGDMRPSTMEWLRRAKNYVKYANQDGFYTDLAQYLDNVKL